MKSEYDIIVVGAGPAGSTAARYAAKNGAAVLLLEKDRDVGYPVRCGEAVSHEGVAQFIQPDPKWIAGTITKMKFISPSNTSVTMPIDSNIGYVLERRIFDYELAKIAATNGAEVVTKAYVYDLIKNENGEAVGVKALIKDEKVEIKCKVVIAADGVESRVGKWAGIDTTCHIRDMESCAQVTVSGLNFEEDTLDLYFGKKVSPGGYLWVFPKGKTSANIGVGVTVEEAKKKSAILHLNEFLEKNYPNASILTRIAGGVPCAKPNKVLVKNRVMLVGDAGHQVNPVSGGGIITGMIGGMIAGEVAADSIKNQNLKQLSEYETKFHSRLGWRHEVFASIKNAIWGISDETLDSIALSTLQLPMEKRTLGAIFRKALWNKPSMVLEVAKVFLN
ncbi:MAG: NAD(P)/FAD-dependent oxidoreductase [Ignavibacteria bacterium]|nr:NAD(P)/FAD-dependent oxidoreductase [Bacteroidota bacterium]MSQ45990.1 NAD(P)/FAD-dependent oxidoreductase [Ignavibacteria bacterium]